MNEHERLRLAYALALVELELMQAEKLSSDDSRASLLKRIEEFKNIYFTGPHGYTPSPDFEKCDVCQRWRFKK